MAQGGGDPSEDAGNPEDGPILSPEELDISEDEHVHELDEGRFVVSPDEPLDEVTDTEPRRSESPRTERHRTEEHRTEQRDTGPAPGPQAPPADDRTSGAARAAELDRRVVHEWLGDSFEGTDSRYGFDVTAAFDGSVAQRRMASNDVVTIFESLVLWYAQQIDADTPVEEVLGILLNEANAPVRYPPESLKRLVRSTDLGPEDSIADLLAAVEAEDGVEL